MANHMKLFPGAPTDSKAELSTWPRTSRVLAILAIVFPIAIVVFAFATLYLAVGHAYRARCEKRRKLREEEEHRLVTTIREILSGTNLRTKDDLSVEMI